MSAEIPDTKYIVPVKGVEKNIKLDDKAKSELQAIGMMDEKTLFRNNPIISYSIMSLS